MRIKVMQVISMISLATIVVLFNLNGRMGGQHNLKGGD